MVVLYYLGLHFILGDSYIYHVLEKPLDFSEYFKLPR